MATNGSHDSRAVARGDDGDGPVLTDPARSSASSLRSGPAAAREPASRLSPGSRTVGSGLSLSTLFPVRPVAVRAALSLPARDAPEEIEDEGQGQPPGYRRVERVRRGPVIGGSITFGIFYFFALEGA